MRETMSILVMGEIILSSKAAQLWPHTPELKVTLLEWVRWVYYSKSIALVFLFVSIGHLFALIGFLWTKIQKYDSAVVDIPNTQLGSPHVINISWCHVCRVLTLQKFEYSDIQKIPKALELIKDEIAESCSKLIKNGKKPFRAIIIYLALKEIV